MLMTLHGLCSPRDTAALADRMISCISDVSAWMKSNYLVQLDTAKSEFMWCAPSRQQYLIPATPLLVDNNYVLPVTSVRDLEIYLDRDTSMKTHVSNHVLLLQRLASDQIPSTFTGQSANPFSCCWPCHNETTQQPSTCRQTCSGDSQRRLPPSSVHKLMVPRTRLKTVGHRAMVPQQIGS